MQPKIVLVSSKYYLFNQLSIYLGGYYKPVDALAEAAMRPSPTFNKLIDSM